MLQPRAKSLPTYKQPDGIGGRFTRFRVRVILGWQGPCSRHTCPTAQAAPLLWSKGSERADHLLEASTVGQAAAGQVRRFKASVDTFLASLGLHTCSRWAAAVAWRELGETAVAPPNRMLAELDAPYVPPLPNGSLAAS